MRIQVWNVAAEKMFGWSKDEVLGVDISQGVDEESYATVRMLEDLRKTCGLTEVHALNSCKDGSQITVKASMVPVFDEQSEIIGFVAVMVDLTELAKKESELLNATIYCVWR